MNREERLEALATFLTLYMLCFFCFGVATESGVPYFWVLFCVYPSFTIYILATWLWKH